MIKILYAVSVFAVWVGLTVLGVSMIIPAGIGKIILWLKT